MTKPAVNYHGLLDLLQTFEKDNQFQKELVNMMGGSSSEHHPFKKEKKNKKVQCAGAPKLSQSKNLKVNKS